MTRIDPLFVGVDWATELHQVCVLDAQGAPLGERQVKHSGEDLAALCAWLLEIAEHQPDRVHVAIEVPHGAVVDTLLEQQFQVHSINPKQLDRFRDRFCASGAKDDRRDALVLADSLRTDRKAFRYLVADSAWTVELRELSRIHDELTAERTKLGNRMRELLQRYFPALADAVDDSTSSFARALFKLIPTPDKARSVRPARVAKLLRDHRIRRHSAETVLGALRQHPLTVGDGVVRASIAHIELLADRAKLVVEQQAQVHKAIGAMLTGKAAAGEDTEDAEAERKQRDAAILLSVPGIGSIVAATLLAEASRLLDERDYQRLRSLSGVAPVTKRSGKRLCVGMRKACHPRLRNALYHAARVAAQHDPVAKARYATLRARGVGHAQALRTVGDRLLRAICAMLRDQTTWTPREAPEVPAA
jgi:transposase